MVDMNADSLYDQIRWRTAGGRDEAKEWRSVVAWLRGFVVYEVLWSQEAEIKLVEAWGFDFYRMRRARVHP